MLPKRSVDTCLGMVSFHEEDDHVIEDIFKDEVLKAGTCWN